MKKTWILLPALMCCLGTLSGCGDNKDPETPVIETVSVTGVSLDITTKTIEVGSDFNLIKTVSPSNASNTSVTWKSSDSTVATVSTTGKVIGVAEGTATITCTTVDGGFTASCVVTVEEVGDLVASSYSQTEEYKVNDNISISFAGKFNNTTGKAISYSANYGEISNRGLWTFTPTEAGEFNVVITGTAGTKTATIEFKLTVKDINRVVSKAFVQSAIYRPGEQISVNVANCFLKDQTVGDLTYSATVGTINSETGEWTYTPEKAGVISSVITASCGAQSATLKLDLTVTGSFCAEANESITLNSEDQTIGAYVAKQNEVVELAGRKVLSASTDLMVPSSESNPVLYFYYSGESSTIPTIYAYNKTSGDLLGILYNGSKASSGGGMGVTTTEPTKSIDYQIYAFDLNEYFELTEATEVEFRFTDGFGKLTSSKSKVRFAGVNVAAKASLKSVEGPFGTTYSLFNDENNKMTKTDDNFVRLDVKGQASPSKDAVTSAVYLLKGTGTMKDYKFFIKGNAEYRIYQYAIDTTKALSADENSLLTFCYSRPNAYSEDSGWVKAKENGQVVYYNGATGTGGAAVAVVVAVRASTENSYVEFADASVADGVYAAKEAVSYNGVADPFTDITVEFAPYFYNSVSGLYTLIFSLGEGSKGSIDAATGVWTCNFTTGGVYSFDVIATAGDKSDSFTFTIEVKNDLVVDEFTLDSYDKSVNDVVEANFGTLVHNSTGSDCVFEANYGTINPATGEWSYTCDTVGEVNVVITITAGAVVKTITFKLNVSGSISVGTYSNSNIYHVGNEIELDLSECFTSEKTITYSSNIGEIDASGVFKYTPTIGGVHNVEITGTANGQDAKLSFTLTVAGVLSEKSSGKVTINDAAKVVGGREALPGESSTIEKSGEVETTINVPVSTENPVLAFAYNAQNGAKINIEVYSMQDELLYTLFTSAKNITSNADSHGFGNTSKDPYKVTPAQLTVFELNPYFTLTEATQYKFVFTNNGSTGCSMGISNVMVMPKENLAKYETTGYGDWYSYNETANNTVSVSGDVVRMDVKGVENPSDDSVMMAYKTIDVAADDLTTDFSKIKLWIKGNAKYRVLAIAVFPLNATKTQASTMEKSDMVVHTAPYLNPNKTALAETDAAELGWRTATAEGSVNYYGGSTKLTGCRVTIMVMVKASTTDTYIEFCDNAAH